MTRILTLITALLLALFAGISCTLAAANPAHAPNLDGQTPHLDGPTVIAQGAFPSPACDGKLQSYVVYASAQTATDKPQPMAVYVRGLPGERIGTASDEELIKGFLADGLLVTVVDYQGLAAWGGVGRTAYDECTMLYVTFGASKHTPPTIIDLHRPVATKVNYEKGILTFRKANRTWMVNPDWVYVVPSGHTIIRNIEVMNLPYPAPKDRVRMDLIAPARPKQPVPTILELSSNDPDKVEQKLFNYNSPYVFSYGVSGYAVAIMGHVYERALDPKDTQTPIGRYFSEHKAIRMLRGRKAEWGLSGKVGMMGISKSSYRTLLTAAKRTGDKPSLKASELDQYPWSFFYRGVLYPSLLKNYKEEIQAKLVPFKVDPQTVNGVAEELDLGPYAKESDCPDVIMCSDGGPAFAVALPYLTDRLPPTIYNLGGSSGKIGRRIGHCVAEPVRDAIRARGAEEFLYVHEPKLYHEFNWYRYDEFKAFFDKQLQPEHKHE
ncbi:MAG: hypothetical protein HZC54_17055 [Verrucomicrobia bacterium]|nr:hypothetical protein [Verrucomicrobiota bacterium]